MDSFSDISPQSIPFPRLPESAPSASSCANDPSLNLIIGGASYGKPILQAMLDTPGMYRVEVFCAPAEHARFTSLAQVSFVEVLPGVGTTPLPLRSELPQVTLDSLDAPTVLERIDNLQRV